MIIFIHGISTSGKTTIGKELNSILEKEGKEEIGIGIEKGIGKGIEKGIGKEGKGKGGNSIFIDQDTYFLKKKPKVKLSNGEEVSNYDSIESIDWKKFNLDIQKAVKKYKNVIIVGFALIKSQIEISPTFSFYLRYNLYRDLTLNVIINNRIITKKVNQKRDILNVKEVVLPFHESIISKLEITHILNIYNGIKRKPVENLLKEIFYIINFSLD